MTPTPRTLRRAAPHAGFTLIEVMIALVVFAIGVLGLAITIPLGSKRIVTAGQQTRGSAMAAEQAEGLLEMPYGAGDLTAGTHDHAGNPLPGNYYVRWVVTDDQPVTGCKRIVVTAMRRSVTATPEATLVIVKSSL